VTASLTRSASDLFTIVQARYVGAKVGADLRMAHNLYGKPDLDDIGDYVEEIALLLRDGYLGTVDFGFRHKDTNAWKLRLRYTATTGGQLLDNRPGSFPTSAAVAGLPFYSYLTYSTKFGLLPGSKQAEIKQGLPVQRVGAAEPTASAGTFTSGHGYSSNGVGVSRGVYQAF
jgi:Bacterial HORMA domain family 1